DAFFFSSRRRHTRCLSDWSSDVCSSDLNASSSGWLVWRGRSTKSRNETRFVLSIRMLCPSRFTFNQLADDQLETVVKSSARASRSEERRVGKEWRARRTACRKKKKAYRR